MVILVERTKAKQQLKQESIINTSSPTDPEIFDIAIIGGGIQGAGVAQAAAAAGYSTALIEKTAWAAATSRSSSKLIHGGLRYLETAQIGLVRECLVERRILLNNAPHLVWPVKFNIPIYKNSQRPPWMVYLGLSAYSRLAREHFLGRADQIAQFSHYSAKHYAEHIQTSVPLREDQLKSVFQYWDAQTNDELLTRAVVASAEQLGAKLYCPARVEKADFQQHYQLHLNTGDTVSARSVVNAGGPWVNLIQSTLPFKTTLPIDLVQGSHIEIPGRISDDIFYLEAPSDKRAVFVIPWYDNTLVGTTETPFFDDPDKAKILDSEIDYLRATLHHYFPDANTQVLNTWAGLRVLPTGTGSAFSRSRETRYLANDETSPSQIAIYGGKLTSYRSSAEKVIKQLSKALGPRATVADTKTLTLPEVSA